MGFLKEFKDFIMRGNVIDLAVAVIIGAAFGGLVKSVVDDVMMPPLGYLMGGLDFSDKKVVLQEKGVLHPVTGQPMDAVEIRWGKALNTLIQLAIQGFAIFLVIKLINKMKKPAPASGPAPLTKDQALLVEIRDLLRNRAGP